MQLSIQGSRANLWYGGVASISNNTGYCLLRPAGAALVVVAATVLAASCSCALWRPNKTST
jgi:hypothetical protein